MRHQSSARVPTADLKRLEFPLPTYRCSIEPRPRRESGVHMVNKGLISGKCSLHPTVQSGLMRLRPDRDWLLKAPDRLRGLRHE